jgi:predicted nucleic acid-binding protein
MYQIVLDTNVLVSALLSNRGASHRLLRMVGDRRWQLNLPCRSFLSMNRRSSESVQAVV